MSHLGILREYRFGGETDDIRGSNVYGRNDDVLGEIDDVIFDHGSGEIQYAVVDSGGWLSSQKFLVPADRILSYRGSDDFYADLTREQIERFPEYDEKDHQSEARWDDYEARYHDSWTTTGDVLYVERSPKLVTADASQTPAPKNDVSAEFSPGRLSSTFTDTAPGSTKLRLRPSPAASGAEDTNVSGSARGTEETEAERHLIRELDETDIRDFDDVDTDDFDDAELGYIDEASAYGDLGRPAVAGSLTADPAAYRQRASHVSDDLSQPYPRPPVRSQRWSAFEESLRRNWRDITARCHACGPAEDKAA
jgi:hypothetical protein